MKNTIVLLRSLILRVRNSEGATSGMLCLCLMRSGALAGMVRVTQEEWNIFIHVFGTWAELSWPAEYYMRSFHVTGASHTVSFRGTNWWSTFQKNQAESWLSALTDNREWPIKKMTNWLQCVWPLFMAAEALEQESRKCGLTRPDQSNFTSLTGSLYIVLKLIRELSLENFEFESMKEILWWQHKEEGCLKNVGLDKEKPFKIPLQRGGWH